MQNISTMKPKRVLSLFSGCGGMDLGFEGGFKLPNQLINKKLLSNYIVDETDDYIYLRKLCFQTVFANDILNYAKNSWIPYFQQRGTSPKVFKTDSIVDLVKRYNEGNFCFPKNIDVLIGGFPCQDFSLAGSRKGFESNKDHYGNSVIHSIANEETRGKLYIWMKNVIEITRPKIFIAENVKGLAQMNEVQKIIEDDLRNIGNGYYILPTRVLKAADYGVPQSRDRIIFIGLNKDYLTPQMKIYIDSGNHIDIYPAPTHINPSNIDLLSDPNMINWSTCSMAFKNLNEPDSETYDLSQKHYSKAKFLKGLQGNIEIKLNSISPTIRAEHHGNIEYRRLSYTNGGKISNEYSLPERRLSVRECARLQTFPDDYQFVRPNKKGEEYPLSASGAYKVIGNAVPPLLAYNIAIKIEQEWNNIFNDSENTCKSERQEHSPCSFNIDQNLINTLKRKRAQTNSIMENISSIKTSF